MPVRDGYRHDGSNTVNYAIIHLDPARDVAVLAACTINLRMVLYSASLAPFLTKDKFRWRMLASYVLVDQVYAVAVTRWPDHDDPVSPPQHRIPFVLGAGALLWTSWQITTPKVSGPAVKTRRSVPVAG